MCNYLPILNEELHPSFLPRSVNECTMVEENEENKQNMSSELILELDWVEDHLHWSLLFRVVAAGLF